MYRPKARLEVEIDWGSIADWAKANLTPDDIFDDETLEKWAREKGFTKRTDEPIETQIEVFRITEPLR